MTARLLRRLVWDGTVDREEARKALHGHVTGRRPFLRVLLEARPDLAARVEAELGPQSAERLVPAPDLLRLLPAGLAETWLAFPVGKDERTGHVRVVAADPSDSDLRAELSFHLGAAVELAHGSLRALLHAADVARGVVGGDSSGAALGADDAPSSNFQPSAPIPLVRAHPEEPPSPHTVKGVAPQGSGTSRFTPAPIVVTRPVVAIAEPVIELTRAKPLHQSAGTLLGMMPGISTEGPSSDPPGTLAGLASDAAPSSEPPPSGGRALRDGLDAIARATTADEVSRALVRALSLSANRAILLSVRGNVFEGRETSDEAGRAAVRALVISGERPSIISSAVQLGSYLGPIPHTVVHHALSEVLGSPTDEVAASVVAVSGRAALVYVMAGMSDSARAIHRAAQLGGAAGAALEAIVRKRRK